VEKLTIESISDHLPQKLQRFRLLFNRFCRDLDSALERASEEYSRHMQSKGAVCEAAIRKYLSDTLGNRYAVTDGFIFDSTGAQSKQQDVIIFDDHWSIRLTPADSEEPPLIPVESVYATIEVKKTLPASELRDAIKNVRSFKSLKRDSVGPEYVTPNKRIGGLGSSRGPGVVSVRNPYFSAIFAFEAGRSMEAVVNQLKEEVTDIPPGEWPDAVVVHKHGIILPYCATCEESLTHVSKIVERGHIPSYLLDELDGAYSILGFHFLLMSHLHGTILSPLNFVGMYRDLAIVARTLSKLED
jgi:hypothetical protein